MKKTVVANLAAATVLALLAGIQCWIIRLPRPTYKNFTGFERRLGCVAYCDRLLENNPSDWHAYFLKGNALKQIGCYQLALDAYNHALLFRPLNIHIIRERAGLQLSIGDYGNSLADYNWIIFNRLSNYQDFVGRGYAYYGLHDYTKARIDADQAIKLNPNDWNAHVCRAYADAALAKCPDAQYQCNIARKLFRGQVSGIGFVEGCLAQLNVTQGNWQKAIQNCDQALLDNPLFPRVFWLRALSYYKLRNYKRAISEATNSIGQNPMVAAPFIIRSQAEYHLKKYSEAQLDAEEAIKLNHHVGQTSDVFQLSTKDILMNDNKKFPVITQLKL